MGLNSACKGLSRMQNCGKATVSFVMSVHTKQLVSPLDGFS